MSRPPADPLGWHVLESWALGQKDPWGATIDRLNDPQRRGDLVESVCADHFRRRFGQFSFYYRDKKGREEIDFVLFEDNAPLTRIEVKYQTRMRAKHRKALAAHGGGLLLTPEHLAWTDDNVASLPVAYLLAMLPWELTLFADPD